MSNLNKILSSTLILLVLLFCFSLFKNIQYPLLWNDEADTAMFATRIIKFGYPKVHDGKNVLYQNPAATQDLAINKQFDAGIETDWLQYYIASLALLFFRITNNIYIKTAILRTPFAIIGAIGVAIMAVSTIPLFKKRANKLLFLNLFIFFELLSVSLVLHLREMRYYSLVIFSISCIIFVYIRYHVSKTLSYSLYAKLLIILSLLLLVSSRTAFFATIFFLSMHAGIQVIMNIFRHHPLQKSYLRQVFPKTLFPIITITIISIPYLLFFRTFYFAKLMSNFFGFNTSLYFSHTLHILHFFNASNSLLLELMLKGLILLLWLKRNTAVISDKIARKLQSSLILSLFFIIYVLTMARVPYYMFTRYFIVLQPILTTIFLLDIFIAFEMIYSFYNPPKAKTYSVILLIFIAWQISLGTYLNRQLLSGHIYELLNQYKGPLDYVIPYIKQNFKHPDKLVIATNYEEFSYMFYLGSKVTIGYVGNNLEEDLKVQPDIIIYRQGWGTNPEIFNYFLRKEKYKVVSFPVYNYPLNNIPEFNFAISHLFKTKLATNEEEKLRIFVREKLIQK